jgi:primosomal protein N' (replication factor Y)
VYAKVAVDIPLFYPLTYEVPEAFEDDIQVGQLVHVPFRQRSKTGVVLALTNSLDDESLADKLKDIADIVEPEPLLSDSNVDFIKFVADYYFAPIGEVVRVALPSFLRLEGKKYLRLRSEQLGARPARDIPDYLAPIIQQLEESGPTPIKELKTRQLNYKQILELESLGLAETFHRQDDSSPSRQIIKRYRRVDKHAESRLGSKQEKLLELLTIDDWMPLKAIKRSVNAPHDSLKRLDERGLVEKDEKEIYRNPYRGEPTEPAIEPPSLTDDQVEALKHIDGQLEADAFGGFLLHGVTGSGKTRVYLEAMQTALAQDRQVLVLLPEISLTPQFVDTFRDHIQQQVAVIHSGLSGGEKYDQWRKIIKREVDVVIGARSALFAPLPDIGLIIVDEEHDSSFKQERTPRYNARDMAFVRAKYNDATIVLGSATPSLESYQRAREGKIEYLSMPTRATDWPLPEVEIIDLRNESRDQKGQAPILSDKLFSHLDETLQQSYQSIVFLNRRGFSPCVICEACGHVFECPNCDVSLTYHRFEESLRCHHCDHAIRLPETCPSCGDRQLDRKGIGTEQLEDHLDEQFIQASIDRLDRDATTGRQIREKITDFEQGDVDILVGTQMVTKGHDFPRVTTVGVVLADLSLNFPDFRAPERTFQLLTQVAGRSGRGEKKGTVFIQTYNPDHYSLQAARDHDYQSFVEKELYLRKQVNYPPFGHLIALKFRSSTGRHAVSTARYYATILGRIIDENDLENISVKGPARAPIAKLKGKTRWQIIVQSPSRSALRKTVASGLERTGYFSNENPHNDVDIIVDVDPVSLL